MAIVRAGDLIRGGQLSGNPGGLRRRAVGEPTTATAAAPLGFFLLVAAAGIALVLATPAPKRRSRRR